MSKDIKNIVKIRNNKENEVLGKGKERGKAAKDNEARTTLPVTELDVALVKTIFDPRIHALDGKGTLADSKKADTPINIGSWVVEANIKGNCVFLHVVQQARV